MSRLFVATALLLLAGASAQWDPATGHIKPTPGVPAFDPAPWNSAYKVTFRNLPVPKPASNDPLSGLDGWRVPFTFDTLTQCSADGFDSTPASSVQLDECYYKNNTGSTFDLWIKMQGLALRDANCYCYALNRFEGDYCSPGTSNGGRGREQYLEQLTCPAVHRALVDDGAVPVTRQQALSGQPDKGHYIAAMARPDDSCVPGHCSAFDYHFLRKDAIGTWSFKFPRLPATDRDLEGAPITDPQAALLPGHYTLCGYYQVEPAKMPIGSNDPSPGPLASWYYVNKYINTTGVSIDISPAPYNPETDAVIASSVRQIQDEDLEWERKRGTPQYEEWLIKQKKELELDNDSKADDSTGGARNTHADSPQSQPASGRRLRFIM